LNALRPFIANLQESELLFMQFALFGVIPQTDHLIVQQLNQVGKSSRYITSPIKGDMFFLNGFFKANDNCMIAITLIPMFGAIGFSILYLLLGGGLGGAFLIFIIAKMFGK